MSYIVVIEGQNIPVPEEIATSDEKVRQALTPFFPDAANAMITRVEKDGQVTINVIKKAGSKGAIDYLASCPGGRNPAVALYQELQSMNLDLDPETMLSLDARLDQAIEAGAVQAGRVEGALTRLQAARPRPAPALVEGF